ncbi:unnamed protein product [Caenorhabditis angaria]|uniref:Uncharacterized protein n=1 Tax=Caenorhabditis angaria TaxID=860376 RepID=A0A9P1N7D5_9PELO|nr:unnamed protein product [Caenorhabditis angaria]
MYQEEVQSSPNDIKYGTFSRNGFEVFCNELKNVAEYVNQYLEYRYLEYPIHSITEKRKKVYSEEENNYNNCI